MAVGRTPTPTRPLLSPVAGTVWVRPLAVPAASAWVASTHTDDPGTTPAKPSTMIPFTTPGSVPTPQLARMLYPRYPLRPASPAAGPTRIWPAALGEAAKTATGPGLVMAVAPTMQGMNWALFLSRS